MTESKKKKPTLEALIMRLLHEADGRRINPMVVAKHFAEGRKGDDANAGTWAREVRNAAIGLARAEKIIIYRKGEPADPENFRGIYRLGLPGSVETEPHEDEDAEA